MQPHVAQRDRLVGVEKERHVAAAGAALLDHGDELGQQLLAVAAVLAQQRGIVLFVERGGGDKGCQVFFDDQRIADRVGLDLPVAQRVAQEGQDEAVLQQGFLHGQVTLSLPVTTSLIRALRSSLSLSIWVLMTLTMRSIWTALHRGIR